MRFGDRVVLEDISLVFPDRAIHRDHGAERRRQDDQLQRPHRSLPPDRGTVLLDGEDITGLPPRAIARKGVARSFQTMNLFNDFSALDNVALAVPENRARGFAMLGKTRQDSVAADKAFQALARVGLRGKADVPAKNLSYGDRRALEIGIALAAAPGVLCLDEPTSGLGREATARLSDLVLSLKGTLTIIAIEHDMEFLFGLADSIAVIHWGQVIAKGTPAELRDESLGEEFEPGQAAMMLQLDHVDTYYGETQALFDVSPQCRARRSRGVAGAERRRQDHDPALAFSASTVRVKARSRFNGARISDRPTHEIARAGVGWVPDDRRLCPTLTVARNLAIAHKRSPFRAWSLKEMFEIFSALEYLMEREAENLSGGEMQMVAIARALLGAPGPGTVR